MTPKQIEKLCERLDERCVDGEGINVTKEDVLKLLDEREALLIALRDAADVLDILPTGDSGQARDAIAKAGASAFGALSDAIWNEALLALGREWYSQILTYAPEEQHEVRKEIYALWRGDGLGDNRAQQPENQAVCDAITAGLKEP